MTLRVQFLTALVCRLKERFEQVLLIFSTDPNTLVSHRDFDSNVLPNIHIIHRNSDDNRVTMFREFNGVLKQVDQNLLRTDFINHNDLVVVFIKIDLKLDTLKLGLHRQHMDWLEDNRVQSALLKLRLHQVLVQQVPVQVCLHLVEQK